MFSIICITNYSEDPEAGVQIPFSQRRIRYEIPFPLTKYLEIPVLFFEKFPPISSGILKNSFPVPNDVKIPIPSTENDQILVPHLSLQDPLY